MLSGSVRLSTWFAVTVCKNIDYTKSRYVLMQVPFLFGLTAFEKVAPLVVHWIFGRTGKHLFLCDDEESPLLLRMVDDSNDLYFMYVWLCILSISFCPGWSIFLYLSEFINVGLHCEHSDVELLMQMLAMIVSFWLLVCFTSLPFSMIYLYRKRICSFLTGCI